MRVESANTCARTVGRLLEVCITGYRTAADADAMAAKLRTTFSSLPPDERVIVVGDWRRCTILGRDVAKRVGAMLLTANPSLLRSGILLTSTSPTAVMQMTRLISEANCSERRVFTSVHDHLAWLGEVTTPEELDRIHIFLSHPKASST